MASRESASPADSDSTAANADSGGRFRVVKQANCPECLSERVLLVSELLAAGHVDGPDADRDEHGGWTNHYIPAVASVLREARESGDGLFCRDCAQTFAPDVDEPADAGPEHRSEIPRGDPCPPEHRRSRRRTPESETQTPPSSDDEPDADPSESVDIPDSLRSIPAELRDTDRWILSFKKEPRAPWNPGESNDPHNPNNWAAFATAVKWRNHLPNHILGFDWTAAGPYVGIDLDDCRDPETGALDDYARDIIDRAGAYAETSPSGTGVHVIVRGELEAALKNSEEGVELYDRDRYFTFTGEELSASTGEIPERQALVEELMAEYMAEEPAPETDGVSSRDRGGSDGEFETRAPFHAISVADVYPDLPRGENVAHPEHASSTNSNFKIRVDGETAMCWHGQHQHGRGDGCGLGAQHLLAMQALDFEERDGLWNEEIDGPDCDAIRRVWEVDDAAVLATYRYAVEEGYCDPDPPPFRAVRRKATEYGLPNPSEGGTTGANAYRNAHRILRSDTGFPLKEPAEND